MDRVCGRWMDVWYMGFANGVRRCAFSVLEGGHGRCVCAAVTWSRRGFSSHCLSRCIGELFSTFWRNQLFFCEVARI